MSDQTKPRLSIEPSSPELVPAIKRFNERLCKSPADPGLRLGERPGECYSLQANPPLIYKDSFVLTENGEVRGGCLLQVQPFWLDSNLTPVVNIQAPLTEGLFDRKYSHVAMYMMRHLLRQHPRIFAVGMGGLDRPFPRVLKAFRWRVEPVPFFFRVLSAGRFLDEMARLKSSPLVRFSVGVAKYTGAAWLGLAALQRRRGPALSRQQFHTERVTSWGDWADEIWREARDQYSFAAVRNLETLRLLYPEDDRYTIVRVLQGKRPVGWAVLLNTQMDGNAYFGNMRVGTILDCFSISGWETAVVQAALQCFNDLRVDVVVTNQSHAAWAAAFAATGFLSYCSNYLVATSGEITQTLEKMPPGIDHLHITRGDGDGRIHL